MNFSDAVRSSLRQYANFSGRARRAEYWYFTLFSILVQVALSVIFAVVGSAADAAGVRDGSTASSTVGIVGIVLVFGSSLALLLPSLAVTCRRLHDTDHSGWWVLMAVVPFASVVLFVFELLDSSAGSNRYGPNPKGVEVPMSSSWA
ncbi:MAG: DUF805 domain-containing protein [Janthinobacterium lividum]